MAACALEGKAEAANAAEEVNEAGSVECGMRSGDPVFGGVFVEFGGTSYTST